MKKFLITFLVLVCFGWIAQSQEMDTRKEKKRIKTEQKQMKQLDIQSNQGQEIKRVNARYRDQHKQIMKNESLTQDQRQAQVKALNDKRVAEIHTIIGKEKGVEWDGLKNQSNQQNKDNKGQQKKAQKAGKENKGKKN